MPVRNSEIAGIFSDTADLLEIKGENQFRVRAYRNAARTVKGLSRDVTDMLADGQSLEELPGIGADLAEKIRTITREGKLPLLETLKQEMHGDLTGLMKVGGLGPKKIKALYKELGVTTLDELGEALEDGRIAGLEGFGEKTADNIRKELDRLGRTGSRMKLADAEDLVLPFHEYLAGIDGVDKCVIAGSVRRRKETVGDIDILVTCDEGTGILDAFTGYEDVDTVVSSGETRSTVILRSGLQVDLRVVGGENYGAALHYFTGSKEHNIAVRNRANGKGLKINEYGVFDGDNRVAGSTEESVYEAADLPYYEPELRENRGELDITDAGRLPRLITRDDIRGDLHTHTDATDGRNTLEEMVAGARERGYDYIANTEHSRHVTVAGGLDADELAKHVKAVRKASDKVEKFTILAGIEVDILEDGRLDLPDDILRELDIVICSVHYKFNLSRDKQTERVLRAMDNPHFMVMAHPTGRMINERDPYDIDMEKIMKTAADRGIVMEINAHPSRLDLDDIHARTAKDMGVKIAISTDAHSVNGYDNIRHGIGQARRGWLESDDVINTLTPARLRKILVHRT